MLEALIVAGIAVMVGGFIWLRGEVRKEVKRVLQGGCPMASDMEARLSLIDRNLEAQDIKTTEALQVAGRAEGGMRTLRQSEEREAIFASVPGHEQEIFGDRL